MGWAKSGVQPEHRVELLNKFICQCDNLVIIRKWHLSIVNDPSSPYNPMNYEWRCQIFFSLANDGSSCPIAQFLDESAVLEGATSL